MTMSEQKRKRGFTIVELLVVIAMLLVLAGAVTSSVSSATQRVKVAQATSDVQEMTKAILAYENMGQVNEDSPLGGHLMENSPATESTMAFILGRVPLKNGQSGNIDVLYNGQVKKGAIRDPWGRPYYVTIRESKIDPKDIGTGNTLKSYVTFPNFNRRPADEVQ